jgi:hypothetical protein
MPVNPLDILPPVPGRIGPYRLVVKAVDDPRRKGYVWAIIPVEHYQRSIKQSATTFKSMAEACDEGAVALKLMNSPS